MHCLSHFLFLRTILSNCSKPLWLHLTSVTSFKAPSLNMGFPGSSVGKESACNAEANFNPWFGKIPWRREWLPTPIFLPGESHGQRRLVGSGPLGHKRVRHDWSDLAHMNKTSKTINRTAAAKSLQSCPTLCDPIDGSPPGSHVPGILQARTLKWIDISFSNAWKWKVKVKSLSPVQLLATPWTAAHQD